MSKKSLKLSMITSIVEYVTKLGIKSQIVHEFFEGISIIFVCKNWHRLFYWFFFLKNPYFIVFLRNGKKIKIRRQPADLAMLMEIFTFEEYFRNVPISWDNVIIDVGAHLGFFTLWAADKCKQVYSFEPEPLTFSIQKENIERNNITNVLVFNKGIWKKRATLNFYLNKSHSGCHSLFERQGSSKKITIDCVSLTSIIKKYNLDNILLKLDCEGAEFDILFSLPPQIFKRIPAISMEMHAYLTNYTREKLIVFLEQQGYTIFDRERAIQRGLVTAYKLS